MVNTSAGRLAAGPLRRQALAAALLAALALLRFHGALFFDQPLGDELSYDRAFAHAASGASPYLEPGFLYPPLFARFGATLRGAGVLVPLAVLRAANAAGLVALLLLAMRWWPGGFATRVALSSIVLLLSPAVAQGVELGNISFLVAALVVGALLVWPRRPVTSGLLLALSMSIKPLAPAAILALGMHRPAVPGTRHRSAFLVAIGFGALSLLVAPGLTEFLARGSATGVLESTVSPYRFVVLAGDGPSPLWWTLTVPAVLAWAVRKAPLDRDALLAVAIVAVVVATPMVWNHTLLITLPLQAMALHRLVERRRAVSGGRGAGLLECSLIGLAVIALHTAEGATGITDRSAALQAVAALPAALAPGFLLAYVLRARTHAP